MFSPSWIRDDNVIVKWIISWLARGGFSFAPNLNQFRVIFKSNARDYKGGDSIACQCKPNATEEVFRDRLRKYSFFTFLFAFPQSRDRAQDRPGLEEKTEKMTGACAAFERLKKKEDDLYFLLTLAVYSLWWS